METSPDFSRMKFKYIGRCAKGQVEFDTPDGKIVMPTGEAVEVPENLAKKLRSNDHFSAVIEDSDGETEIMPKRRGRPPKSQVETQAEAESE